LRRATQVVRGTIASYAHITTRRERLTRPIVVDGCVFQEPHSGIARVWRSVLEQWADSRFASRVLVVDRGELAPKHPGFAYEPAPLLVAYDIAAERTMLQSICDRAHARVFVSTLYSYPRRTPSLLLVHDLTPEVLGWNLESPMWRDKRNAIRHASAFECDSQNTADDLHRIYPETSECPTAIVRLGVADTFHPAAREEVRALLERLDLPDAYYVFVGHRDIHKNAELVFDALSRFEEPRDFGLLLVGGARELEPRYRAHAGDTPVRIARLSDPELRAAYTGAAALLFPSRHEGFGLVILEAMACGCPVVTCRNSALPEAAGEAALYVGEDAPDELAEAMRAVLDPVERERLVAAGFERSARFDWRETAQGLAGAIQQAGSIA
jgi:glycosyltransferase involved in cell wall biosynthesis